MGREITVAGSELPAYPDLSPRGWIPAWRDEWGMCVENTGPCTRRWAETQAAAVAGVNGIVVPALDWSAVHPLLAYTPR